MNIEKYNTITLNDDKQYVVISKIIYENNTYLYIIDINDNSNIKFCFEKIENQIIKLEEVEDKEIIQKLIPLFANDTKDILEQVIGSNK